MPEQGETYATFIEGELKAEVDRRASLDARALAVVTSSSALVTLMFALSALLAGKDATFTGWSAVAVVAGLGFFVCAGLVGILANVARDYTVTHEDTLQEMVHGHWVDDEVDARNACAYRHVVTITSLRKGNEDKAEQITSALLFQVAAVAALVLAIVTRSVG